jgi:hypothetical protein
VGALFKAADGIACAICGAVYACPRGYDDEPPQFGSCCTCWSRFKDAWKRSRQHRHLLPNEDDFNGWVARMLVNAAKRQRSGKMIGRCEAYSLFHYHTLQVARPYQCANLAVRLRDGHRVCGQHYRATENRYVSDTTVNPYDQLSSLIRQLVKRDPMFECAIREALDA